MPAVGVADVGEVIDAVPLDEAGVGDRGGHLAGVFDGDDRVAGGVQDQGRARRSRPGVVHVDVVEHVEQVPDRAGRCDCRS